MGHDDYSDDLIAGLLRSVKSIAVVGFSADPARPSHYVARFLAQHGYDVTPINPGLAGRTIFGAHVHASLAEVRQPVDMVDVFRNSDAAGAVVDEALALDPLPKVIWMQLGVRDEAAARRAEARGVQVIMDRCPKIEIERLFATD